VKLIAQLKLLPAPEQVEVLRATLERANAACDHVSPVACESGTFREYALRTLVYGDLRATYGLGAQIAQHCMAKVADAYTRDSTRQHRFRPTGSLAFDDRNLSYALPAASVSIWALKGRQSIPFACGERQGRLLQTRRGESDLVYSNGQWFLLATCEVAEPAPGDLDDAVDLAYPAGHFDGEGCIRMSKRANASTARLIVTVTCCYTPTLAIYRARYGGRTRRVQAKGKPLFRWELFDRATILAFLQTMRPYLQEKAPQVDAALAYLVAHARLYRPGQANAELTALSQSTCILLRDLKHSRPDCSDLPTGESARAKLTAFRRG
jgi:hypothetical protein